MQELQKISIEKTEKNESLAAKYLMFPNREKVHRHLRKMEIGK
jgi:hypothetical protein